MNEIIRQILNWVMIFFLVIFGLIFVVNFYQQGYFWKYMRVKGSRGKKVMVQVETLVDKYLAIGHIEEGFLVYRKRFSKRTDTVRIAIPDGAVYRALGIYWVNVDEKKNAIMKADYSTVDGHDAELTEDLIKRALNKPSIRENKMVVLIVLLIVVLVGLLVVGMLEVQILKKIASLNKV